MRKLALLCVPIVLALSSCSSTSTSTPAGHSAEKAADVHSTDDLVRLMRQTTSFEYDPYSTPRAMLKDVDIALVGKVVSIRPAIIDDELDGQGAVIVGLQPREIWKDDSDRSGKGKVVYYYFHRPKNLEIGVYQTGLPVGTEISLFGFDIANLVKFAYGGLGHTTYTPAPQGHLISARGTGLINVWAEDVPSSTWKDIRSVADLKAAIGK